MNTNDSNYIVYDIHSLRIIETFGYYCKEIQLLCDSHDSYDWLNLTNSKHKDLLIKINKKNPMDSDELKAMKKKISLAKFKHVKLEKDGKIYVDTPVPYTVVPIYDNKTYENMFDLNEKCKFFYNIMKLLKISYSQGAAMELTLNKYSGMKLTSMAMEEESRKYLSHEIIMLIKNYNW